MVSVTTHLYASVHRQRQYQELKRTGKGISLEVANAAEPGRHLDKPSALVSPPTKPPPLRAPRMYLGGSNLHLGQVVELSPEQTRYLVSVMRLREGSLVRIFDGVNGEFVAAVCSVGGKGGSGRGKKGKQLTGGGGVHQVKLRLTYLTREQPISGRENKDIPLVELIFAPIRKQRLKMLVEKAVEIGASSLTPVLTARTQKGAVADASVLGKLGATTAVEAAEQCERMTVPHVKATPVALASLLEEIDIRRSNVGVLVETLRESDDPEKDHRVKREGRGDASFLDIVFVCKERDVNAPPILEALAEYARVTGRDVGRHIGNAEEIDKSIDGGISGRSGSNAPYAGEAAFLVGPEGGFDPAEINAMAAYPFVRFVSLGPTVLRAETAAVYALSSWSAFWAANRAGGP